MSFENKRIILTGASGGIGRHVAEILCNSGAKLTLVDLDQNSLEKTQKSITKEQTISVVADITKPSDREAIISSTLDAFDGIDILINVAGINPFGSFQQQDPALIQKTLEVNTLAPMLLTHAVLPYLLQAKSGQIVNLGSTFGSIGFAWFTAYSSSKFALRGFSQALRRELADTNIDITYIAPRSVKTAINSTVVYEMAKEVKMNMDEPKEVAEKIVQAILKRKKECYIGFPESFFARLNAVLPGLVDNALQKQDRIAKTYAIKS